jgi:hypothetical protein
VTFAAFTEEQWAAIRSLRDKWPADIQWAEVRQEIEQAGRDFWTQRANRLRRPPVDERDKLARWLRQVRKLQEELPDDLAGVTDLAQLERAVENRLIIYEIWAGKLFRGQADAHRELLYWRLLQIWTRQLHGALKFSRRLDSTPTGPAVQFAVVALKAILGDEAPSPAGIKDIILKERWRRLTSVLKRGKTFEA